MTLVDLNALQIRGDFNQRDLQRLQGELRSTVGTDTSGTRETLAERADTSSRTTAPTDYTSSGRYTAGRAGNYEDVREGYRSDDIRAFQRDVLGLKEDATSSTDRADGMWGPGTQEHFNARAREYGLPDNATANDLRNAVELENGTVIQNEGERGIYRDPGSGEIVRRDPGARTLVEQAERNQTTRPSDDTYRRSDGNDRSTGTTNEDVRNVTAEHNAERINDAIEGPGTSNGKLIDALSGKSPQEIREIQDAYQSRYGRSLEDDIRGDTSGGYQDTLLGILNGNQESRTGNIQDLARRDAAALNNAMGGDWDGTDEEPVVNILTNRSPEEIRAIATEYEATHGESLRSRIDSDFSFNQRRTLLAIIDKAHTPD